MMNQGDTTDPARTGIFSGGVGTAELPAVGISYALGAAGLSAAHVDAVAGMWEGLSDGFVAADRRDAVTTTPTTLGAWAHAHLRPR